MSIFIGLGANLPSSAGGPAQTLVAALGSLEPEVRVCSVSAFYETSPWPNPDDPPFTNAVARVETLLSAAALMTFLHGRETAVGRKRSTPNGPRVLDLDIIDYKAQVNDGWPILPHPRLSDRAFVLIPLMEIAPEWRHPLTGSTVQELIGLLPLELRAIRKLTP